MTHLLSRCPAVLPPPRYFQQNLWRDSACDFGGTASPHFAEGVVDTLRASDTLRVQIVRTPPYVLRCTVLCGGCAPRGGRQASDASPRLCRDPGGGLDHQRGRHVPTDLLGFNGHNFWAKYPLGTVIMVPCKSSLPMQP